MTTQTLPLNLIPKGVCPRLYVSQYDKGQTWYFDLYAGTEAYTIPSEASVTIQGTKPDKTGFQYACTFSGNRVEATEQQQMTIIAGEVPAELRIEKDNEIIATLNFIIAVEKAALADDTVISETDLPLIEEAIEVLGHADELVQRIEGDVTTSGNNALKAEGFAVGQQNGSDVASGSPYYHNSAKYYKEQAANSASTASNKASDASGSASAASGSASSASTNALKAEGFAVGQQNGSDVASGSPYYHNSAKYYKEQAANSASTASTKAGEAAASAQAAAQSAAHLTIDSAMSTTSENALQNKVISTTIQNLSTLNAANGAKNICPYKLANYSSRGITITDSTDGKYKILNGTCTGNPLTISLTDPVTPYPIDWTNYSDVTKVTPKQLGIDVNKKYVLSRQSFGNVRLSIYLFSGNTMVNEIGLGTDANVNSIEIDFSSYTFDSMFICAKIGNGLNVSNYALKPMLCLKTDWDMDNSWTPCTENNYALTENKVGMDLLAEVGGINRFDTSKLNPTAISVTINDDGSSIRAFYNTAASWRNCNFNVDVEPNTYYRVKAKAVYTSGEGYIEIATTSDVGIAASARFRSNTNIDYVFNSGANTKVRLKLFITASASETGDITYNDVMICPVSYNGSYVPYAKSNRELTKDASLVNVGFPSTVSGYSYSSNSYVLKKSGIVDLNFAVAQSLGGDGTEVKIFTLPAGCRPLGQILTPIYQNGFESGNVIRGWVRIATNGDVSIFNNSGTAGQYLGTKVTFIAYQ